MTSQETILRAVSGEITWIQAAHIGGISPQTLHRWKKRYLGSGKTAASLLDDRIKRPRPKHIPIKEVERILRLYRDHYDGFHARHFYDKATEEHDVTASYTFVKETLQKARFLRKRKA